MEGRKLAVSACEMFCDGGSFVRDYLPDYKGEALTLRITGRGIGSYEDLVSNLFQIVSAQRREGNGVDLTVGVEDSGVFEGVIGKLELTRFFDIAPGLSVEHSE